MWIYTWKTYVVMDEHGLIIDNGSTEWQDQPEIEKSVNIKLSQKLPSREFVKGVKN